MRNQESAFTPLESIQRDFLLQLLRRGRDGNGAKRGINTRRYGLLFLFLAQFRPVPLRNEIERTERLPGRVVRIIRRGCGQQSDQQVLALLLALKSIRERPELAQAEPP
jgi:hypothetical protein